MAFFGRKVQPNHFSLVKRYPDGPVDGSPASDYAGLQLLGDQSQAKNLRDKYQGVQNPIDMEDKKKRMEAPPNLVAAEKQRIYGSMIVDAHRILDPDERAAEIGAIGTARRQHLDKSITDQVNDAMIANFREWLMKQGEPKDHVRAGWWPTKPGSVSEPGPMPKFIKEGGCLSEHPSVRAYIDTFVTAPNEFEKDLVMMRLEASHGMMKHWSIDKCWRYYKFVVQGLKPDLEFEALGPMGEFAAPPAEPAVTYVVS